VLEVGSGIGATTLLLNNGSAENWSLLEPDANMREVLQKKINNNILPLNCRLISGTIDSISKNDQFDCIIYIDVLEHIRYDKDEITKAAGLLKPGGHLIILSPAFQYLYNPFDKAIGHYRRYSKKSLTKTGTSSILIQKLFYLDSIGFFASLFNKLLLRQSYPTKKQIMFWDKWIIPISKITDSIFFYSFGKSILAIWKKQ